MSWLRVHTTRIVRGWAKNEATGAFHDLKGASLTRIYRVPGKVSKRYRALRSGALK